MYYIAMVFVLVLSSLFGFLAGRQIIRYIVQSKSHSTNKFSYKAYFVVLALLFVIAMLIGLIKETYNISGAIKICSTLAMIISAVFAIKVNARK